MWVVVKDGHPAAYEIARRHYSHRAYQDGRRSRPGYRNRRLFVGPGEKLVLLSADGRAVLAWRKFRDRSGQQGVNCAMFRNESQALSSSLILAAEAIAWARWPGARLYTYVDWRKVRSSNPGYCFKQAGWRFCGRTKKRKLIILEKTPVWGFF